MQRFVKSVFVVYYLMYNIFNDKTNEKLKFLIFSSFALWELS